MSSEVLTNVLKAAHRLAGAKGGVIVKVTRGGEGYGYARRCSGVYENLLRPGGHKQTIVRTHGGIICMGPMLPGGLDPVTTASVFFSTAIHEFVHVREFQEQLAGKVLPWSSRNHSGRRPPHKERPEELRAKIATTAALRRLSKRPKLWAEVKKHLHDLAQQLNRRVPEQWRWTGDSISLEEILFSDPNDYWASGKA